MMNVYQEGGGEERMGRAGTVKIWSPGAQVGDHAILVSGGLEGVGVVPIVTGPWTVTVFWECEQEVVVDPTTWRVYIDRRKEGWWTLSMREEWSGA